MTSTGSGPFSERTSNLAATLAFRAQLLRLRLDRLLSLARGRRARPRVMATACWSFPIYSQTFVYQELTQLVRRGFDLRFVYSNLDRRERMPSQFDSVWRARRRLSLHPVVCEQSYAHFVARVPDRVDAVVDLLSRASGLSPDEVRGHRHVRQAFAFARMVDAYGPDYLHSYFFYEGTLFAFIASTLLDVPRGVSCYADHMLDDYALKVVGQHLRQCSITIATSRRIKQELLAIEPGCTADDILVKPNGINVARFPVLARAEPAPGERFRLVCVNRIEPKKGLLYLVEAMALLRARNVDVEVHLIGGVDATETSRAYAAEVNARIEALGLGGLVHLQGRRSESEINAFFKASHIFVAPFVETEYGDKDGIPTSLLEAMATGLPAVATDAGSILEVIDDGHDGVIVPQRDPEALADAIAGLIADAGRRANLGRGGAEKIRRAFDVTVCERVFHTRLDSLLAATREAAPSASAVESV